MNKFASLLQKIATLKKIAGPGFTAALKKLTKVGPVMKNLSLMSDASAATARTAYNKNRRIAQALGGENPEVLNFYKPQKFGKEIKYKVETPENMAKLRQYIILRAQGKMKTKNGIIDRTNKARFDRDAQGLGGKSVTESGSGAKPDPTPNPEVVNPDTTISGTTQQVFENLSGGRPSWFARHPILTNTMIGGGSLAAGFGLGRGTATQRTPQEILADQYTKVNSNFWQRLGGAPDYYYKKK